jgi:hypothetical protein
MFPAGVSAHFQIAAIPHAQSFFEWFDTCHIKNLQLRDQAS